VEENIEVGERDALEMVITASELIEVASTNIG
jgi:hypothetical protein